MQNVNERMVNKTFYGRGFSGHVSAKMLFAAVFVAMVALVGVVGAYSGGAGTVVSPYQINNSADIRYLSTDTGNWNKYFIVTNDIDLAIGGSPTAAIGTSSHRFTGTFDGQGYMIRNFNLSLEYGGVGLFGYVDSGGEIRNLDVETTANGLYGAGNAGVIVGNNKGKLTNCSATGDVTTNSPYTGQYAGVLVGFNSGTVTNCYATGDVTALYYAGGLVGTNTGSITNCSATGSATASSHAGGLVGYNSGSLTNCYATGSSNAGNYAGGLVGQNNGPLKNCYATGNVTVPDDYAGGLVGYNGGSITDCSATGDVNATDSQAGGLVGHNEGSLTNCSATGSATAGLFVGGLVGINDNLITITNCSATGNVTAIYNSAGGLSGVNYGFLTNCYATGNITAISDSAGGLVGVHSGGIITNCYATGSSNAGVNYAGGLVGYEYSSDITNCYATGSSNAGNYAGGLVGYEYSGGITNCYATGTAKADPYAGGLVGNNDGGTITNCYCYTTDGNLEVTLITDITKFKDYDFLTGSDLDNGLKWDTEIISTAAAPSKTWRVFTYKVQYPIFQWQSFGNGTLQVHSGPEDATILFNGVSTGEVTNHTFLSQPVGVYKVTVMKDGYHAASQTVTLTKDESEYVSITMLVQQNVSVSLSAGWNMISVPVANATITLPSEAGQIYRYNGNAYEPVADPASVPPGVGLWMPATGPCNLTFTGTALNSYTEPVPAGWNMIGSCSEEIESFLDHLSSIPAVALSDQIYAYDPAQGKYVTPTSCTPGCGYWISVSEVCNISLSYV